MKFSDNSSSLNLELHQIPGTDYWADRDGDLYVTHSSTGMCYHVSAEDALLSILRRKSNIGGYCPVCDESCLKPKARQFNRLI